MRRLALRIEGASSGVRAKPSFRILVDEELARHGRIHAEGPMGVRPIDSVMSPVIASLQYVFWLAARGTSAIAHSMAGCMFGQFAGVGDAEFVFSRAPAARHPQRGSVDQSTPFQIHGMSLGVDRDRGFALIGGRAACREWQAGCATMVLRDGGYGEDCHEEARGRGSSRARLDLPAFRLGPLHDWQYR